MLFSDGSTAEWKAIFLSFLASRCRAAGMESLSCTGTRLSTSLIDCCVALSIFIQQQITQKSNWKMCTHAHVTDTAHTATIFLKQHFVASPHRPCQITILHHLRQSLLLHNITVRLESYNHGSRARCCKPQCQHASWCWYVCRLTFGHSVWEAQLWIPANTLSILVHRASPAGPSVTPVLTVIWISSIRVPAAAATLQRCPTATPP